MKLNKTNWTKEDYDKFIEYLYSLKDEKYLEFQSKLICEEINIIGIRIPKLKEIAKEIVKGNYLEFIKLSHDDLYEEKIIHGLIIGYIKEDFKVIINLLDTYIPCIDNWAVNDTVCANLKIFKNNQEGYRYIKKLLKSREPFTIRFALVLLLDFYVNEEYIDKMLKIINEIKHDNYYVKMANAWALSICYIKYPEKTIPFLKKNNLDKWTQNKAISKIKDSKRVAKEEKLKIDKLKK